MNFLRLSVGQMTIHMYLCPYPLASARSSKLGAPFAAPLATRPCDLEGERATARLADAERMRARRAVKPLLSFEVS